MGAPLQEAMIGQMKSKRARVSSRRQVTIPQKFYEKLNIKEEVEFVLRNDELLIQPVRDFDEGFAEHILIELVNEGLSGDQLIEVFRKRSAEIRPAMKRMLEESAQIANNHKPGNDETSDIFGDVMED